MIEFERRSTTEEIGVTDCLCSIFSIFNSRPTTSISQPSPQANSFLSNSSVNLPQTLTQLQHQQLKKIIETARLTIVTDSCLSHPRSKCQRQFRSPFSPTFANERSAVPRDMFSVCLYDLADTKGKLNRGLEHDFKKQLYDVLNDVGGRVVSRWDKHPTTYVFSFDANHPVSSFLSDSE